MEGYVRSVSPVFFLSMEPMVPHSIIMTPRAVTAQNLEFICNAQEL